MLSDVNENLLFTTISGKMGVQYLSVCTDTSRNFSRAYPKKTGKVYGSNARPMIALRCWADKVGSIAYQVIFILDMGAPTTELPPTAMDIICGGDFTPSCVDLFVAGEKIEVNLCNQSPSCNHRDVPVLGKNFFLALKAHLEVNYKELTCSLTSCIHSSEVEALAPSSPSEDIERLVKKL